MTNPKVTFNIIGDQPTPSTAPQKVLIVGQKTAAGTATSGAINQSIQNNSEEDTLFGINSKVASMVRMFKRVNPNTQLDVIGLDDDGSAVDATGTITFVGTATENGTLVVNIGSRKNNTLNVDIVSGDSETDVAAKLVAAVTADATNQTTAGNVAGVVTLTAVNGGLEGNFIGLEVTGNVVGITTSMTAMIGGLTNPSLATVFDGISDKQRYQHIVFQSTFTTSILTGFLDPRLNVTNNILDGDGFQSFTDAFTALKATFTAEDTQSLWLWGNEKIDLPLYKGSQVFEGDAEIASSNAAISSIRLTEGVNIIRFITPINASLDSFGGVALSSKPYHNTPANELPIIDIDKVWSEIEIDELNTAGGSIFDNNDLNTILQLGTVVTTYKTNTVGQLDDTFHFGNIVKTSSAIRETFVRRTKAEYPQSRATVGNVVAQRGMTNVADVRGFLKGLYTELGTKEFALTVFGQEADTFFDENLFVTFDPNTGKFRIEMKAPPVTQVREFEGTIQTVFEIAA